MFYKLEVLAALAAIIFSSALNSFVPVNWGQSTEASNVCVQAFSPYMLADRLVSHYSRIRVNKANAAANSHDKTAALIIRSFNIEDFNNQKAIDSLLSELAFANLKSTHAENICTKFINSVNAFESTGRIPARLDEKYDMFLRDFVVRNRIKLSAAVHNRLFAAFKGLFYASQNSKRDVVDLSIVALRLMAQSSLLETSSVAFDKKSEVIRLVSTLSAEGYFNALGRSFVFPDGFFTPALIQHHQKEIKTIFNGIVDFMQEDFPAAPKFSFMSFNAKKPEEMMLTFVPVLAMLNSIVKHLPLQARFELLKIVLACPQGQFSLFDRPYFRFHVFKPQEYAPFQLLAMCFESVNDEQLMKVFTDRLDFELGGGGTNKNVLFGLLEVADQILQNAYNGSRPDIYDEFCKKLAAINIVPVAFRQAATQVCVGESFFLPEYVTRIYPLEVKQVDSQYVFFSSEAQTPDPQKLEQMSGIDLALDLFLDYNSRLLRLLNTSNAGRTETAALLEGMFESFDSLLSHLPDDVSFNIISAAERDKVALDVSVALNELRTCQGAELPAVLARMKGYGGIVNMLHRRALGVYNTAISRIMYTRSESTGEKVYINGAMLGVANLTGQALQDNITGRIIHPYFDKTLKALGSFQPRDIEEGMIRVKKDQISMHLKLGVHYVDLNFTFKSPENGGQIALSFSDSALRVGQGEIGRATLIARAVRLALGLDADENEIVYQNKSFIEMSFDQANGLDSKSRIEDLFSFFVSIFGRSRHLNIFFYERTFDEKKVVPFAHDILDQDARLNQVKGIATNSLANDRVVYGRQIADVVNQELKRLGGKPVFSSQGLEAGQRVIRKEFLDFLKRGLVTGQFVVNEHKIPEINPDYEAGIHQLFDLQLKKHSDESASLVIALSHLRDPLEFKTVGSKGGMLIQAAVCPAADGSLVVYILKDPASGKIIDACPVLSIQKLEFGSTLPKYDIGRVDIATALDILDITNEVYSVDLIDMMLGFFDLSIEHDEYLSRRIANNKHTPVQNFEFGVTISQGNLPALGHIKFDVPGVKVGKGDILVSRGIQPRYADFSKGVPGGIWVTGIGSLLSHEANVAREHNIPCVMLPADVDFLKGHLKINSSGGDKLVIAANQVVFLDAQRSALGLWGFENLAGITSHSSQDAVYELIARGFRAMAEGDDVSTAERNLIFSQIEEKVKAEFYSNSELCALGISLAIDFPEYTQHLKKIISSYDSAVLYNVVSEMAFELKCGFKQQIKNYVHDVSQARTFSEVQLCNQRLLDEQEHYRVKLNVLRSIEPYALNDINDGDSAILQVFKVHGKKRSKALVEEFIKTLAEIDSNSNQEKLRYIVSMSKQFEDLFPFIYKQRVRQNDVELIKQRYEQMINSSFEYSDRKTILRSNEIYPLNSLSSKVVGNKACQLVRMGEKGFSVPVWTFADIRSVLEQSGIWPQLVNVVSGTHTGTYEKLEMIEQLIAGIELPAGFEAELEKSLNWLGADVVAVRTSGVGEDGELSFAGIGQSFARVKGIKSVIAAVCGVIASGQTPEAKDYIDAAGLDRDQLLMPVWIHPTIDAEYSAVVFTKNPSSGRKQVVIQGVRGMLAAVVDGSVTPDTIVFEKSKKGQWAVTSYDIGDKEYFLLSEFNRTGVKTHVTGTDESRRFCLPANVITAILKKIEELETIYGADQEYVSGMDIELAVDNKTEVHIVQKRRITSGPFFKKRIKNLFSQLLTAA